VFGGTAVSTAVTGDTVDWKCYRYRVFETIVPLRNSGWRPTAS
jgi:type IV pilus assembly protein PilW